MSEPAPAKPATVHVSVHLHGDDSVRAEFSDGMAGPFVTVRIAGPNAAAGVDLFVSTPEQADSLICAAVIAKDLLIAAQVTA